MRVCYFGAYKPEYPRNQILRAGLAANGVEVVECRVSKHLPTIRRAPLLINQYRRVWRQCDVLLLAEFGQSLAPVAWALARLTRKPLVADMLVSYYDLAVEVRRAVKAGSWQARRFFWFDAWAVRLSNAALADAEPHRQYFIDVFGGQRERVHVVPLGVNDAHFVMRPQPEAKQPLLVMYYGTYTPAHGVETMIRAAARLASRADLFFQFLGDGQDREMAEALARELKLTNVRFDPPVPYADLPAKIACADICLGEFGDTLQTKRGLANKVYQTLAMGKPLINGDTPSIRSLFSPGEHLAVSPLADSEALAQTIAELADDPARRAALASAGRQWTLKNYTPPRLGKKLLDIILEIV